MFLMSYIKILCKSNLIRGAIHLVLAITVVYRMAVLESSRTDCLTRHLVMRLPINILIFNTFVLFHCLAAPVTFFFQRYLGFQIFSSFKQYIWLLIKVQIPIQLISETKFSLFAIHQTHIDIPRVLFQVLQLLPVGINKYQTAKEFWEDLFDILFFFIT